MSPSLILLMGLAANGVESPIPAAAKTLIERAQIQAAKEGKNVYVYFQSHPNEWCGRHNDFLKRGSAFFRQNFVTVRLTPFESSDGSLLVNQGSSEFLREFGGGQAGFPFFAVINPKGDLLGNSMYTQGARKINLGHPWTDEEVDAYIKVMEKAAAKSTKPDLAALKALLLAQDGRSKKTLVM